VANESPFQVESMRATFGYAQSAIRTAFLLNGGSLVGIVTFIGGRQDAKTLVAIAAALSAPVRCFVLGVIAAAITLGLSYISQSCFTRENSTGYRRAGVTFQVLAALLWLSSIAAFSVGAFSFPEVIAQIPVNPPAN
jgi:hypothetical protein